MSYEDDNDIPTVTGDISIAVRNARSIISPPVSVLSYRAVAGEIKFPDGPKVGEVYDPDLDPIHAAIVMVLETNEYTRHVWVGAVQTGKSLLMTLAMLRVVTQLKQSLVYSQPTHGKIGEAWVGKIHPIVQSSTYNPWLPRKGFGSKGSNSPPFIQFRDPKLGIRAGIFYFIAGGGKSEAAQAGTTAPWIFNDEVDSYKTRHRIELIAKRADSFGRHARRIYTSTVKSDDASIILGMYSESTQSRLYFQCPHCEVWEPLEWENVVYDATDEITAMQSGRYVCPKCAVRWTEMDRKMAHRNWRLVHYGQEVTKEGEVTGEVPRTLTFGLLWTGLDSSIRTLSTMTAEHYRALRSIENGDHGPMRSFYRDQLCRMYEGERIEMETQGTLKWQFLHQRTMREKWGPFRTITDRDSEAPEAFLYSRHVTEPPAEAAFSTAAIDVQGNRVYWMLRCFDRNKTTWISGYGYDYSRLDHDNHNEQELHAVFDRVAAAIQQYCGQTALVLVGVDIGDNTDQVRRWVDGRGGIYRNIKGYTQHMKADASDIEGLAYWREGVILMQADNARDMFHASFRRPLDTQGTTHIANGIGVQDATLLRHLVSEQSSVDPDSKKRIIIRGSGRNDWLDCAKMTEVLIYGYLQDQRAYEVNTPMPIRAETKAKAEQEDTPIRVASSLATNRQRYDREGNPGIHRINRRSSRFLR